MMIFSMLREIKTKNTLCTICKPPAIVRVPKGCVEEKNATDNAQHESNYRSLGPFLPMFATGAAFSSSELSFCPFILVTDRSRPEFSRALKWITFILLMFTFQN